MFRYAAELVDDVDPQALQRALDKTVDTFPGFNVCLRSGMFWHYLSSAEAARNQPREPSDLLRARTSTREKASCSASAIIETASIS